MIYLVIESLSTLHPVVAAFQHRADAAGLAKLLCDRTYDAKFVVQQIPFGFSELVNPAADGAESPTEN